MVVKIEKHNLVIPSCAGVLDCFNNKLTKYYCKESMCHLQGKCDNLLVLALFSFVYQNKGLKSSPYTFKLSDFKKYIGFVGGGKSKNIQQELLKLCEIGYVWQYVPEDRLIEIAFTGNMATVSSTYFNHLYKHMSEQTSSSYSSMVSTTILKERNKGAVEITIELVKLIERRGQIRENQTAEISIPTLIERCSTLYEQVKGKGVKEQNRVVKTSLFKALDLLRVHTQVYACFKELEIYLPEKINLRKENKLSIKLDRRILRYENRKIK